MECGQDVPRVQLGRIRQSSRLVDRSADHRVLEAFDAPDVPGHHFAAGHADAHVESERRQPWLQGSCRPEAARGMVCLRGGGAEHAEATVPLELVDPAAGSADHVEDHLEELVDPGHHHAGRMRLGERRRPDDVDEERGHVAHLPAQLHFGLHGLARHLLAHVAAEEVFECAPLAQPADHGVEAGLQLTQVARIGDLQFGIEVARLDPLQPAPHSDDRLGHRPGGQKGDHSAQYESGRRHVDHGDDDRQPGHQQPGPHANQAAIGHGGVLERDSEERAQGALRLQVDDEGERETGQEQPGPDALGFHR